MNNHSLAKVQVHNKNVGIHLLLVCHLRPTTALSADEQSDTHERIADTPVSVL